MQEVQDEGDVAEAVGHAVLQRALAVGDDHPGAPVARVALFHLGFDAEMKVSLSAVRLAQTRLWVGRGRDGRWTRSPVQNRLSRTSWGVRMIGTWLC